MSANYTIPDTLYLPVENFPRLPKIPQTADEIVITLTTGKKYRVVNTETYSFVRTFGTFGSGNGELNTPLGITYDFENEKILVSNSGNNRIEVFDLDGSYSSNFGTSGTGNGEFDSPNGLIAYRNNTDTSSNLLVADRDNNRLQLFLLSSSYSHSTNTSADRPTAMAHSKSNGVVLAGVEKDSNDYYIRVLNDANVSTVKNITVENAEIGGLSFDDENDQIWATTRYNTSSYGGASVSSLLRYNYSDDSLTYREDVSNDVNGEYHGLTVAKDSSLFVTRPHINRIERRLYNGDFTAPVLAVFGSGGSGNEEFVMPRDCVQVNNSIYILDTNNHRVVEYSASNDFNSIVFTLEEDGTAKFTGKTVEANLGDI